MLTDWKTVHHSVKCYKRKRFLDAELPIRLCSHKLPHYGTCQRDAHHFLYLQYKTIFGRGSWQIAAVYWMTLSWPIYVWHWKRQRFSRSRIKNLYEGLKSRLESIGGSFLHCMETIIQNGPKVTVFLATTTNCVRLESSTLWHCSHSKLCFFQTLATWSNQMEMVEKTQSNLPLLKIFSDFCLYQRFFKRSSSKLTAAKSEQS